VLSTSPMYLGGTIAATYTGFSPGETVQLVIASTPLVIGTAVREWTERADEATRTTDDDGMTDGRRRFQTDAQRSSCGCTRSKR